MIVEIKNFSTNFKNFFFKTKALNVFFKGSLMAITDMVPGISGSSVAIVLGIYKKLLISIKNINFRALFFLNLKKFAKSFDFAFFIPLLSGMLFSFLTFSKIIVFLLSNELCREMFLSFFLGAVFFCIYSLFNEIGIKKINFSKICLMLIGGIFSFLIAYYSNSQINLFLKLEIKLMLSGFVAILAMLLPGISGSLILVIFGVYPIAIEALSSITSFESLKVLFFLIHGIFLGLLIFPKIILIFLEKYYFLVLSFLIGLMAGSIYALWPFWIYEKNIFANKSFLVAKQLKFPEILSIKFFFVLSFFLLGFFIFFKVKQKLEKKPEKI